MLRSATWAAACLAALACGGCLHSSYLLQAIYGQDEISYRARDIGEVVDDPSVPLNTRQMLAIMEDVKTFGEAHGLTATDNYREFADLKRGAAVWVVSAAHPLRFESVTWWFPIAGSVPYLGWFNERDAKRHHDLLKEEGWDVDLRTASAYSTLGWFDDPILSTMIPRRPSAVGDLVGVVLHESVHATHYVSGQTYFNESLADWVGDTLAMDYLENRLRLDRWNLLAYLQAQDNRARRAKMFHEAYKQLDAIYASDQGDGEKLAAKQRITSELRERVGFWRPINNAVLAQSRQYHGANDVFKKLFDHCGSDWRRFWDRIHTVDASSFDEPQMKEIRKITDPLLAAPCP